MKAKTLHFVLLASSFILIFPPALGSQELRGDALKQVDRIPRRVLFLVTDPEGGVRSPQNTLPFSSTIDELLYSGIADRQPIVRVEEKARAHNVCTIRLSPETEASTGDGGENENEVKAWVIEVRLSETSEEEEKLIFSDEYRYTGDMNSFTGFLESTVEAMAGELDLVEPEIRLSSRVETEEEREMVEELTFADKLKRPVAARIGVGNLFMEMSNFQDMYTRPQLLPLFLDFIWYPRSNHGLLFSLMTDLRDADGISGLEAFILPGIGYSYRSIGRLAAGLDTLLYVGGAMGQSTSTAYTLWGVSPSVNYNYSPSFGISCKFASLYLSFDQSFGERDALEKNIFFQRILALSLVYRP